MGDVYKWLGIETYADAEFLKGYDPTHSSPTESPVIKSDLAQRAYSFLMTAIQQEKLDVSAEFITSNLAQILLIENLYYHPVK